jgi:Cytochrome c oxidase subunit III/LAGLIDADG DNA endonuclease family
MNKINRNQFQSFPFHLVEPSPWPILVSFSLLNLTLGAVMYMQGFTYGGQLLSLGFTLTVFGMILWFRDIITEGTYLGHHTIQVQKGLTIGVVLFIISEVFAFLSVFWAFFHSSLSPTIEIGGVWPPQGITPLDPFAIPLLNTILLLSSGALCQKWSKFSVLFYRNLTNFSFSALLPFNSPNINSRKRIGPHNIDVLSILIGSLLGDGQMEKDEDGFSYRFVYYKSKCNGEYFLWLHGCLSKLGYCKKEIPFIKSKILNNELRYYYRFRTYNFYSINWIYDSFYINNRKVIPSFIGDYLTPLALAFWIMDDGSLYKNKGLKFCNNCFTLREIKFLQNILLEKYNLESTIHKTGDVNQYNIYILKSSMNNLINIVKPHIHPTMIYKIINLDK